MLLDRPETAGRTLAEINDLYQRGIAPRKWKKEPRIDEAGEIGLNVSEKVTAAAKHIE